jgi:hypothetical protein
MGDASDVEWARAAVRALLARLIRQAGREMLMRAVALTAAAERCGVGR